MFTWTRDDWHLPHQNLHNVNETPGEIQKICWLP